MTNFQDTHIGKIPKDAHIKPLRDCISTILDYRGKTPKKLGSDWLEKGIPAISAKNIHNGELDNRDSIRYVSFDVYKKWMKEDVKRGDCFLVSEGATLGEVLYWDYEYPIVLSQRLFCIRTNPDILYSKYFYAYMNTLNFQTQIKGKATGSSVDGLRQSVVLQLEVPIIPMENQKFIGDLLYSLEKKKKDLQEQNKTLETIAQTIFKEWLGKYQIGDELPAGWSIGEIGDLTEIKRGGSPRPIKDYISDSGYRWLKISDATATKSPFIFKIKQHIKVEGLKKTTLKKAGDLVLSNSATPGMPKFLAVDTCVHDGWMHFPSSKVSNEYLYLLFLHIKPKLVQQGSGSVFVNLKTDILRYFKTIIPTDDVFKDFDKIIKPIFNKIYANAEQIQTLNKTRYTLLPKLMSGAIRVNEINN